MKKLTLLIFTLLFIVNVSSAQWQKIFEGLDVYPGLPYPDVYPVGPLGFLPSNPSHIFAIQGNRLFFSTNSGDNWILDSEFPLRINVMKINNNILYMLPRSYPFFYRSKDFGLTWDTVKPNGIYLQDSTNLYIKDLFFNGSDIYLATQEGPYKSTDDGKTWNCIVPYQDLSLDYKTRYFLHSIISVPKSIIFFNEFTTIYTCYLGCAISSDREKTWNLFPIGKWNEYELYRIGDTLLSAFGRSVFLSADTGKTWKLINDSASAYLFICDNKIYYAIDSSIYCTTDYFKSYKKWTLGNNVGLRGDYSLITLEYIFTSKGSWGDGAILYRAPLKDCEIVNPNNIKEADERKNDFSISPNPATDFIEISLGAEQALPLQIRIYDVFGREMSDVQHLPDVGHLSTRIDVSGLVPGLYFVRVGDRVGKFLKVN